MKRISWAITALVLLVGCGEAPVARVTEQSEPQEQAEPQPESPNPAPLNIAVKDLNEPLTHAEVADFIDLMKSLPGGIPPEFAPFTSTAKVRGLSMDEAILAWRRGLRDTLTVQTFMSGWEPNPQVRRTLIERDVAAPAMVSLMLRMSCTLGLEVMGGRRNIAAQKVILDQKIVSMVDYIQSLHRTGHKISNEHWQGLEQTVGLSEYMTVLLEVPESNEQVVAASHDELKRILIDQSKAAAPSETNEENHVVPVRFDESAKPQAAKKTRVQTTR